MFPEWTWIVGLLLGATIGSFLNVVIYRMPRGKSLSKPANSFCPSCEHALGVPDLFPLFSWLIQRGRCRYCGEKISSRYFFVELVNGIIWAGVWYQYLIAQQEPGKAIAYALASAALVAIIWIDLELYLIPDQINAFLAFVGIGYNIYLYQAHKPDAVTWGMPSALAGWLVGTGVLWGIAFLGRVAFRKDAMGHGDIKMARGIGAILFPTVAIVSFALAVALGAIIGIFVILLTRSKQTAAADQPEDEEEYQPESIGSLLKSGLGYFLGIDILGLFYVPLYRAWFGESPYDVPDDLDTFKPSFTMIPFGPYLALGAIIAAVFSRQLVGTVENYLNWVGGGKTVLEHFSLSAGQILLG
jgi:leader peptidase (prepilin peptidase)/N-methyltransferase